MLKPQHLHWPLPDTDPSSLMVKILGVRPPKSWRSSQCARKYRAKNWLKMSQSAPDYWSGVQSLDWLKGHLKETILSFLKCLPLIMRISCNFSLNPYDSMCFFSGLEVCQKPPALYCAASGASSVQRLAFQKQSMPIVNVVGRTPQML